MPHRSWLLFAFALSAFLTLSCSGEVTYLDRPGDNSAAGPGGSEVQAYYCQDTIPGVDTGECNNCDWLNKLCFCSSSPNDKDPLARDVHSCSAQSVDNGVCCKRTKGETEYCQCTHWGCQNTDFRCLCQTSSHPEYSGSTCQKAWPHCCARRDAHSGNIYACICSDEACSEREIEVPSCEHAGTCRSFEEQVTSCQ